MLKRDLSEISLPDLLNDQSGLDGVLEDVMFDAGRRAIETVDDTTQGAKEAGPCL
jgi:hypothetical protein